MSSYSQIYVTFAESEHHCPLGFAYYDQGRCYKYEGLKDDTMSLSEARERCASYNDDVSNINQDQFDVVSVRDEHENDLVTKILTDAPKDKDDSGNDLGRNPYTLPWIGLYKKAADSWNSPTWSDGSLVIYSKWSPNAPSDYKVCS